MPTHIHISLEFYPSFLPACKMKLAQNKDSWSMTVSVLYDKGNNEKTWEAKAVPPEIANKVVELGSIVVNQAMRDNRIILDGIGLKCLFIEDEILKVHEYRCPEQGTDEWVLAGAFLVRAENLFKDRELTNYLELLEGYFDRLPVKLFDEIPKRLRIYGRLSSFDLKGLENYITKVTNEKALILDLTNLQGMGTVLYKQFELLKLIPELKVLVSAQEEVVLKHVKEIGFKDEQIELR